MVAPELHGGPVPRKPRRFARWVYYIHRWIGVAATALLIPICITGILLNHKKALGLMPDVSNEPSGSFSEALPLAGLASVASQALPPDIVSQGIDRMDVRPSDGFVKVRYRDRRVTEVTVDINTGEVLHIGERNDDFLEKLHSGQIFGDLWVLVSDAGAIFLLVIMVSGYWLWLYPKSRV
jgi:uncharacterized iron-regulated membrane protein